MAPKELVNADSYVSHVVSSINMLFFGKVG